MIAERMSRLKLVPKHGYLGFFDCDCACAAPPNTQPVADASRESAEIMAQLGRDQLAESRRQYDLNRNVSDKVVNTQTGLMDQAKQQGDDYFAYQKNFRPVEMAMLADSFGLNPDEIDSLFAAQQAEGLQPAPQQTRTGGLFGRLFSRGRITQPGLTPAQIEQQQMEAQKTTAKTLLTAQGRKDAENMAERDTIKNRQAGQANELLNMADIYDVDSASRAAALENTGRTNAQTLQSRSNNFEADQRNRNAAIEGTTAANALELRNRTNNFDTEIRGDISLATGGDRGIADRYRADIQDDVGQAVADARMGQTSALNTAARQALRYGLSVPTNVDTLSAQNAMSQAAAANNTRNSSIDRYRSLVRDGIGLKSSNFGQTQTALGQAMDRQQQGMQQGFTNNAATFQTGQSATTQAMDREQGAMSDRLRNNRDNFVTTTAAKSDAFNRQNQADSTARNQRIQDESLDWARRLDVTGMARGLPGASQGAYQVSIGAGNSAVSNNAQAGNSYLAAINQGVNTIGQGQQMNLQGLSNVLNAQTSFANSQNSLMANSGGSGLGDLGSALGGAASLYRAFGASDRDLKEDIKKVGKDEKTGLNEYEFKYKGGKKKFRGVMADEVEDVDPAAVREMPSGFKAVNYARLGIEMKEVK